MAKGFRNRVVALHRVRAGDLRANPKNWRIHPEGQRHAVRAMLERIGIADAFIGRRVAGIEGFELLDGHLRQELDDDAIFPLLEVDLNDQEAAEFLVTHDPLSALALTDETKIRELLKEVDLSDHAELRKLTADLAGAEIQAIEEAADAGEGTHDVPGMELNPHEHYDYLVVLASSTQEWNVLCGRLGLVPTKRRKGMGTARAIRAGDLLTKLGPTSGA